MATIDPRTLTPAELAQAVQLFAKLKADSKAAELKCRVSPHTLACTRCGIPGGQAECRSDLPGTPMVMPLARRASWGL